MKRNILFFIALFFASVVVRAQGLDFDFSAKPTDYRGIGKRILAVEILEEDNRSLAEINRWIKENPGGVEKYQKFIKSYNENIKQAIEKYWTLNTEVEYKTTKDIQKLIDGRDKKYEVLKAIEVGGKNDFITRFAGTAIALVWFRPERTSAKDPDYKILLPYSFSRPDGNNPLSDYMFTIRAAAENINSMEEKKRPSDFVDFMENEAMANCTTLKEKTLLVERDLTDDKINEKEIKEYYEKEIEVVKHDVVADAVNGGDENKCYTVLVPYNVFKNPLDNSGNTYLLCYKIIVNASDGKILNYMKGKAKTGGDPAMLQEKDFKDLNSCSK